jgi:hypothetical protein
MRHLLLIILVVLPFLAMAQQQRVYYTGPKGGCYYINKNGNKTYVDHSFCNRRSEGTVAKVVTIKRDTTESTHKESDKMITEHATYYKGPKGGCYYINKNGDKVYVERSLCN